MATKLHVGNLSFKTTEAQIQDLFKASGNVVSCRLIMDKVTGRSKGFAFVEMGSKAETAKALADCNGKKLDGRALNVNTAKSREERPQNSVSRRPSPHDGRAASVKWEIPENMDNSIMVQMRWHHYIAYFFGGAFLLNSVPHLVAGVSGSPFQTPFASPPGQGLSSSTVNVLWATFNLLVAYLLLRRTGNFELRQTKHVVPFGLGVFIMAIVLALAFGRLHGGLAITP